MIWRSTLSILFILLLPFLSTGQNDTLLWNDFQTMDLNPATSSEVFGFPDQSTIDLWINWDEDLIQDNNGDESNFYNALDFHQAAADTVEVDSNFIAAAASWLLNLETTSSNWLITPAIFIGDDQATLHWKSSPLQCPRYMDGYTVRILVDGNSPDDATEDVTVYEVAQMRDILADDAETWNKDSFSYTPGYIHADCFTLMEYLELFTEGDSTLYRGKLEPHSVSLAEFAGKTIHVAYHHDSSDDNRIGFDDILVLGNEVMSNTNDQNIEDFRFVSYPNPATDFINVMYRLDDNRDISLNLYNQSGQLIKPLYRANGTGEMQHTVNVQDLTPGSYLLKLTVDGQSMTKTFIKN